MFSLNNSSYDVNESHNAMMEKLDFIIAIQQQSMDDVQQVKRELISHKISTAFEYIKGLFTSYITKSLRVILQK